MSKTKASTINIQAGENRPKVEGKNFILKEYFGVCPESVMVVKSPFKYIFKKEYYEKHKALFLDDSVDFVQTIIQLPDAQQYLHNTYGPAILLDKPEDAAEPDFVYFEMWVDGKLIDTDEAIDAMNHEYLFNKKVEHVLELDKDDTTTSNTNT